MFAPTTYQLLADLVLLLHFAVVAFVVGGPLAVVLGNRLRWPAVNRLGFRLAHLAAIGFVALQAWLGATCPLTILENRLRVLARNEAYGGSFIEHWIQRILFYEAPAWVFTLVYTAFLLVVIAVWRIYPPATRARRLRAG